MSDEVLVTCQGAVHVLSLNRPDRLNAFNPAMSDALLCALRDAADDRTCRAVLLRGEGRGFCSGQDLTEVPASADLGHLLELRYVPMIRALRTMAKPVVCAVHGVAAGAGANLALACDIVVAGQSARFVQAFIKIGLVPDVGGTWFLPRAVGAARARALALLPTHAIGLIKQALDASEVNTLEQQLVVEQDAQRQAGYTDDFREGVQAFLEKRPARFSGQAPRPT